MTTIHTLEFMAAPLALFDGHANSYDPQDDHRTMDKNICDHMVAIGGGWWPSIPVQEVEMATVGGHSGHYRALKGYET